MTDQGHVKIAVPYATDAGVEVETLWAIPRGDGFEVDNVPFYAKSLAVGDVIAARAAEDGLLEYVGLIKASGHSTLRIVFDDERFIAGIRKELSDWGAGSEISDLPTLLAVDVPPAVDYAALRNWIEAQVSSGRMLDYEEACIGGVGFNRE